MADDANDQQSLLRHAGTDEDYARLMALFARLPQIEAELAEAQRAWDAEDAAKDAAKNAAARETAATHLPEQAG